MNKYIIFLITMIFFTSCSSVKTKKPVATPKIEVSEPENYELFQTGRGSWYGKKIQGKRTASGEKFDMYAMTAAHNTLPFGTIIEVTNLQNEKKVIVRVNDRGPHINKRILDLSLAAFNKISNVDIGVIPLEIKIVSYPTK